MPDETIPSQSTASDPNKKTLMIVGVAVAIILIVGAIWFFSRSEPGPSSTTDQTPGPAPWPSALPGSQPAISFKDYINLTFDYSLKYPEKWFLDTTQADKDFANDEGGTLTISNAQKPMDLLLADNPPLDLAVMNLTVYQVPKSTSVDQFIKDKKYGTPYSQAPTVLKNFEGKQMLFINENKALKREFLNLVTVLKKDTKIFVFSYNSFKPDKNKLPDEVMTVHDEIIKSFSSVTPK